MVKKKALITGICGQDGSYLAELLLSKNYELYGLARSEETDKSRLTAIKDKIHFIYSDVTDTAFIVDVLKKIKPDEIYNLAAKSFVPNSRSQSYLASDTTASGAISMLEAIRVTVPNAKFFQAASSEIFGNTYVTPQTESTPFYPRTPYGVSKLYAHFMTVNYRDRYKLFCTSGIMYNHESPRRGHEFVTRKITSTVAKIKLGLEKKLILGSIDAKRDWGFAGDYVRAMWLILQQDKPSDYIIATGQTRSVEDLVKLAFSIVNLNWKDHVIIDEKFCRPAEPTILCGDSSKAKIELGWQPQVSFENMIEDMIMADLKTIELSFAA